MYTYVPWLTLLHETRVEECESTTRSKQSKGKQINYTQDNSFFFQGKREELSWPKGIYSMRMIVCNHPLFGVFQSSVSVKRLREFLKGNEIDPNNVERSEEPATGMYV